MPRRLTRKEKQSHTRSCLLRSAGRVFTRRGLQQASIDEVAEDAGYTKGAFYANFRSKEELFLAMLDDHFSARLLEIERTLGNDGVPDAQERTDFTRAVSSDPEWSRLFFEFAAHAARNEEFRQELVARYGSLRQRMAEGFRRHAEEQGAPPPLSPERLSLMTFVIANGFALEQMLEPDAVSEELYGELLTVFFAGLRALSAGAEEQPLAAAHSGAVSP